MLAMVLWIRHLQHEQLKKQANKNKQVGLHSSVSKEFACNAGDPGSNPGLGRSSGGGIGSPVQHSWFPLVVQLVKNLPIMRETWVRSLGWEDPLEKGIVICVCVCVFLIFFTKRDHTGHTACS